MRQWHVVAYGSMAGTDAVRAKNIMKTHKKRIKVSRAEPSRDVKLIGLAKAVKVYWL